MEGYTLQVLMTLVKSDIIVVNQGVMVIGFHYGHGLMKIVLVWNIHWG